MSVALEVQKAIRARLVASSVITDDVPPGSILDRNQRPAPTPSIIIGEAQAVDDGESIARRRTRVWHTIHVWKKEPSLAGANEIAGNIRQVIQWKRPDLGAGLHCIDCFVSGIRTVRDPDGETSHAIVTVEALVLEVPQ
ncbi:DUF3168 domain-containing protein [Alkalilacustris brevis]|uniref:DUF3168 domain-containing protein n=1 Tax=Alkalilacustris brevis TaxID=2026338 RepID=UPI000E0DE6AC|nr:DUF3168 domain-containing protein [Alkalilacustris brevis]